MRAADQAGHPVLVWSLSLLVGVAGTLALFPIPVLLGTAPYWNYPQGVMPNSWGDMAAAISGYDAYAPDRWRWPLFQTDGLGPHGISVVFTDSIPVVALLGRLLFRATGQTVNLYGIWSGLCVAGMALASTGLVRTMGARGWAAGLAAAAFGVSMPVLLARWGHLGLFAQALLPLSLAFYVRLRHIVRPRATAVFAQASALCATAILVHPYLLLMAGGIVVAAILQAATDRRMPARSALATLAGLVASTASVMAVLGYWGGSEPATAQGFGLYSTNLLSPLFRHDLALPGGLRIIVEATGGQYEGSAYLGLGLLALTGLAAFALAAGRPKLLRRHVWLAVTLAGFTLLAVTNVVYIGAIHVLSVPLPQSVLDATGLVRASGRFVWPAVYALAALAIVIVARARKGGLILLVAAGLQWADAEPVRHAIRASVAGPAPSILDMPAWRAVLPAADRLLLDPPFVCLMTDPIDLQILRAAVELQLMSAQAGVPTNTVYAGRMGHDCSLPLLTGRTLVVRVRPPRPDPDLVCRTSTSMSVCGARLPKDTPASLAEMKPFVASP